MSVVAGALLNNAAIAFGDVVAMASVNQITSFANYLQRGIGQGSQSVLGYNLGARNFRWAEQGFLLGASGVLYRACSRCCNCDLYLQLIYFFRNEEESWKPGCSRCA